MTGELVMSATDVSIVGATSTSVAAKAKVSGDAQQRYTLDASGTLTWGSGTAVGDVTLGRTAVGVLGTNGAVQAATVQGGSAASGTLTVSSTSNATKGKILLGTSAYDEANNRLGVGNSAPAVALDVTGQVNASTIAQAPTVQGGTGSAGTLTLTSTTHATKGKILVGTSGYDEVNNRLGVGNTAPGFPLDVTGAGNITGNLTVGGNLSVTGIGSTASVRKTAPQAVTSSTTMVNDADVFFSVAANATYQLIGLIVFNGDANIANIKTGWTAPASATLDWILTGQPVGATGTSGTVATNHKVLADLQSLGTTGTGNRMSAFFHGFLVTAGTAGTLQFQWAQLATSVTATSVLAGTSVVMRRVA